MKKIKLLLWGFMVALMMPCMVNAASGTISVSGSSTAVVGNKVTVTVTLKSGTAIGSWQMDLNYDKSYLQLVSSSAEGGSTRMVNSSAGGTKSKTYTFAFKTLKAGKTRVSVGSYLAYDYANIEEMSLSSGSKTINIITQEQLEASYSKDNNLKSLEVVGYTLDKEFNKDTLEYTVNVPTGTTSVEVKATLNDRTASISGTGEVQVTEGLNTIPIVVTAQNGSSKTYTLTVNVEDQNPIQVSIDNQEYTVVKTATLLTAPSLFEASTVTINNIEIPAFINTSAGITLIGLKDAEGTIFFFIYDNGKYMKYEPINLDSLQLIPVDFTKTLDLIKTSIEINGEKVEAYKYSDNSSYVIINAKSLIDGKTNLYLYDPDNKNAILFDEAYINETNETIKNYTYIIIAFASALVLLLVLIFSLLYSLRKKQKKINKFIEKQEAKIEATKKLNDVVAEVKKVTENETKDKLEIKEPVLKHDTTEIKKEDNEPKNLSKKELKKLRKQKKLENKNEDVEIKELQNKTEKLSHEEADIIEKELEKTEEMYDLFEDEHKKKKNK